MPYKDVQKRREYLACYRLSHQKERAAYNKKWAATHGEQKRATRKKRVATLRKAIRVMCGDVCPRCGVPFGSPVFHHIGDKRDNVGRMFQCSPERLFAEIDKCVVMCQRCHKGLHIKGKNYNAKLTREDVEDIRNLSSLGFSGIELSKVFKISQATISKVINNGAWKNV